MTSRLLMSFRSAAPGPAPVRDAPGSTRPTAILDLEHPLTAAFADRVRREARARGAATDRDRLRTAHGIIASAVRPVYSVDDLRRVSRTLRLGRGSCSQRMAVLEAVARSLGVPTRVRGLLVDGAFWYPRFPGLRPLVPEDVLLAWPEFLLDGAWVPVADLFADHGARGAGADGGAPAGGGFTNSGPETLFEAVARTAVDWDAPPACAGSAPCDLSAHLRTDLGRFTSRDELFARHGQTLCLAARTLAEPVLGRWSAGAGAGAKGAGGRAAA
ncbi:transglutaminase domain-containing protein [Streptomyces sp. WAC08241]|uniref:transglutaminase domain-containing protein n=1 Tax=Streptomyces sp. WAC08241 TaxID=2487421 RepID=UPI000F7776FA|nr:transglutaminase domain-containing protein [Streptomyces sp. WAC08241]RSS40138.1 transglutaminase domain-containing protein [Streptomyces sp. WAC08241]